MDTSISYQKNILITTATTATLLLLPEITKHISQKMLLPKSLLKKRSILYDSIKVMDIIKWHYKHIFIKHDYFHS